MFNKKSFLVLVALYIFSFAAFAYDGTVFSCEILDAYTSSEFEKIIGSDAFEQALYENICEDIDGTVDKFFAITQSSSDDEDMDVISGVEDYIDEKYNYSNGSTLATGIVRNKTRKDSDGWYVVSNYSDDDGWTHYMFYFHVTY